MNYQEFGTVGVTDLLIEKTRLVSASDLDAEGVLEVDLDILGECRPVLILEEGLPLSGLRLLDGGTDSTTASFFDGATIKLKCESSVGCSIINDDPGVTDSWVRILTGSGDLNIDQRIQTLTYDSTNQNWVMVSPFAAEDYSSDLVKNTSSVTGANVSDAFNGLNIRTSNVETDISTLNSTVTTLSASSPTIVVNPSLVVPALTWTTVLTLPLNEGTGYTFRVLCDVTTGNASNIDQQRFGFEFCCHRNVGGSAAMDGAGISLLTGSLGTPLVRGVGSGNNILFQIQWLLGGTAHVVTQYWVTSHTF